MVADASESRVGKGRFSASVPLRGNRHRQKCRCHVGHGYERRDVGPHRSEVPGCNSGPPARHGRQRHQLCRLLPPNTRRNADSTVTQTIQTKSTHGLSDVEAEALVGLQFVSTLAQVKELRSAARSTVQRAREARMPTAWMLRAGDGTGGLDFTGTPLTSFCPLLPGTRVRTLGDVDELRRLCSTNAPGAAHSVKWAIGMVELVGCELEVLEADVEFAAYNLARTGTTDGTWWFPFSAVILL
eukprot:m.50295 g.50295  ORF g.50295 m.50295 type:complete len:242 (+) comp15371_c0_seq6:373-1098(+)